MQKLKQTGIALIVAGLLSANAYAGEAAVEPVTAQPVAAFTEADLNALFEQEAGKPMQLAVLSGQEMKETEGAWLLNAAGAFVGGASGAFSYMTSAAFSRQGPSNVAWGLTRSIATGAVGGAIRPVNSIGRALGTLSSGVASGAGNAFISNRGWRF